MPQTTSTYLDACRFLACLVVIVCHTDEMWVPGNVPFASRFAAEAVGVFFVLSGFVIAYAVDSKETDASTYTLNRLARVYSVALPCVVLTVLLDAVGRKLVPAPYIGPSWGTWKEPVEAVIDLTFVNEVWNWNLGIGSNTAYWSLYYEVTYYVAFGVAFFGRSVLRAAAALGILLIAGRYTAILFFLWLIGAGCYQLCRRVTIRVLWARVLLAAAATIWISGEAWHLAAHHHWWHIAAARPMTLSDVWTFFAGGLPFAASILGVQFADLPLARLHPTARWLSGATFTLYLLHCPLGTLVHALLPKHLSGPAQRGIIWGVTLTASFVLAEFTERRKGGWRTMFEHIFAVTERRLPQSVIQVLLR